MMATLRSRRARCVAASAVMVEGGGMVGECEGNLGPTATGRVRAGSAEKNVEWADRLPTEPQHPEARAGGAEYRSADVRVRCAGRDSAASLGRREPHVEVALNIPGLRDAELEVDAIEAAHRR